MTTPFDYALSAKPFRLDRTVQPWRVALRPARLGWYYFFAAGLALQAIPGWILAGPWAAFGSLAAAGFLLILARRAARRHGSIVINDGTVTVDLHDAMGGLQFSEPLSAFQAVRHRERVSIGTGGAGAASTTSHKTIIELVHADQSLSVPLLMQAGREDCRAALEDYARAFGLPARETDDGQVIERAADDLDKSLRERIDERSIKITHDPLQSAPKGIAVERTWDSTDITLRSGWVPWFVVAVCVVVGLPFSVLGYAAWIGAIEMDSGDPAEATLFALVMGSAGVAILIGGATVFVLGVVRRRMIRISRAGVELGHRIPLLGYRSAKHMALEKVEVVSVHQPESNENTWVAPTLLIAGDGRRIETGLGLKKASLAWLRDHITATIARA